MKKNEYLDIAKRLEKFSSRQTQIEIPDVIYHYCSLDSFTKIIESGSLFLTHHSGMNDRSDSILFYEILIETAQKKATKENFQILEKFIYTFYLNIKDYFIASFSKKPDLLNQWKMYGDNGNGISIGFRTESLYVKPQIPYFSSESEMGRGIFPLEYISETDFQLADELLNLAIDGWFNIPPNVENLILAKKHNSFISEEEIRIVEIQDTRININPDFPSLLTNNVGEHFNYRIKNNEKIIPYRIFPFKTNFEKYSLQNIWLGPLNKSNPNYIRLFLEKNNIDLVEGIFRSKSPYTGY
ncbi:DUF2971 domain-containing protein [Leptospira selangorensis]|uniref:DUF2971 domain-containing protein n=1 Tax=Leptospira selangorensis TaxID=2484982 RepID=A0ABY2N3V4_9LEPT|nr:DUF2971 domain-containing protein [Leptospira selangorensis]TGM16527.1 DUF2971 domain-containing protein [Leptospira selangorensis]